MRLLITTGPRWVEPAAFDRAVDGRAGQQIAEPRTLGAGGERQHGRAQPDVLAAELRQRAVQVGIARGGLELDARHAAAEIGAELSGNVRELENVLERAMALADNPARIEVSDLRLTVDDNPVTQAAATSTPTGSGTLAGRTPLQDFLDRAERETLELALAQTRGNRTQAAKLLGITFRSMRYRLERLGLEPDDE